jgi:hypothetical protein
MKPVIKIILIALIIIIVGLIVYFVWSALAPAPENPAPGSITENLPAASSTSSSTNEQNQTNQPGNQQNGSAVPTLEKISENPVFDFWVDPQTKEIYYVNPDGQVFSAKKGQDIQITQQKLNAPNFMEISPSGQRALMAFGAPRSPQWGIFDVIDETWRPLPDIIFNATWGMDNNTLIAFVKSGGYANLSSVNISQNQPTFKIILKDLRLEDVKIDSLSANNILIEEAPSAGYSGRVWNLNLKTLVIYPIFSSENGLTIKMSYDKKILFAFSADRGFRILNASDLSLASPLPFTTLPSKCSPDSSIIYCFVPVNEDLRSATLPDDYLKQKLYTSDVLYRMDLPNDGVEPVFIPQSTESIDAKNPAFLGGTLYFINRYDNSLYSLSLGY